MKAMKYFSKNNNKKIHIYTYTWLSVTKTQNITLKTQ